MDYYGKRFSKLADEFHEVMHDYPLFIEILDDLQEHDIKEINEFLDRKDEFYLKKAIDKLERLIEFVKNTSNTIKEEYEKFDKYARIWEKLEIKNVTEKKLDEINSKVKKANLLINKHDVKSLIEANKIMEKLIKDIE